MKQSVVHSIFFIAAISMGCSDENKQHETVSRGTMALTSTSGGYCFTGTVLIKDGNESVVSSIATDCTQSTREAALQEGDYTVEIQGGYACSPPSNVSDGYLGCQFIGSDPNPFHISAGAKTPVTLTFTFNYANSSVPILFGAGSAQFSLSVTESSYCYGTTMCPTSQKCASLNGGTVACYDLCTTTDSTSLNQGSCAVNQVCTPVVSDPVNPAAPVSGEDGAQASLNDIPHVCVSIPAPPQGTGGASSTGGAPSTGGTPPTGGAVATGGMISTGGSPSTGGLPATGGDISTGGTPPTGGAISTGGAATGGTPPTGGTPATGGSSAPGIVSAIVAGTNHACAVVDGGVKCWGYNLDGELGNNSTTSSTVPVQVQGLTTGVVALASRSGHTCALLNTGSVQCWGVNAWGQLGNNAMSSSSSVPVLVQGLTASAKAIAAGDQYTCALLTTGTVQCWGENNYGEFGNGTTVGSLAPVQVSVLSSGVIALGAGSIFTSAITSDNTAWFWGSNSYGQFGDSTLTSRTSPTSGSYFSGTTSAIAIGSIHSCVITLPGTARCMGNNGYGQLGNNSTVNSSTPVQVVNLTSGVTAIAAGNTHTCAIVSGTVRCWGSNSYKQLGSSASGNILTPYQVTLPSGVTAIAAGLNYTCAIINSHAQCWGDNEFGQLGNSFAPMTSSNPYQVQL